MGNRSRRRRHRTHKFTHSSYTHTYDQFTRPASANVEVLLKERLIKKALITREAHDKMWALVQQCPIEIGWLCTCMRLENGNIRIEDVFVPLQNCTMGSTLIRCDGEAEMLQEFIDAGKINDINRLRCWGHSHVNMGVFASATDVKTTEEFLEKYDDYFVRVIMNKRGECYCSIFLLDQGITIHHAPMQIEGARPAENPHLGWATAQIAAKVTEEHYVMGDDEMAEWEDIITQYPHLLLGGPPANEADASLYPKPVLPAPVLATGSSRWGGLLGQPANKPMLARNLLKDDVQ